MMQMDTDPRLVKLRKYESVLVISGFGVIAFGMWSIIRAAIYYLLNPLDLTNYLAESELAEIMAIGREGDAEFITDNLAGIVTAFIFIGLMIDLMFRVYVGLSARRDGRRLKKSVLYIIIVWIMAIVMFAGICLTIDDFIAPIINAFSDSADEAFEETAKNGDQAASVSLIVDITSFLVLLEVGVCSINVRRLRKQLGIVPVRRRKKDETHEFAGSLTERIKEELNIPMDREEAEELGQELGGQLSDGLSTIAGIRENTGE